MQGKGRFLSNVNSMMTLGVAARFIFAQDNDGTLHVHVVSQLNSEGPFRSKIYYVSMQSGSEYHYGNIKFSYKDINKDTYYQYVDISEYSSGDSSFLKSYERALKNESKG